MSIKTLGKKIAPLLPVAALALVMGFALTGTALADCSPNSANPLTEGINCSAPNGVRGNLFGESGIFQTIANTLIFLVGAIAVLFLIIGGLRYVISNGDPKNVEAAKNTILYAIVGIVVAILSFAAVQFVISSLAGTNA